MALVTFRCNGLVLPTQVLGHFRGFFIPLCGWKIIVIAGFQMLLIEIVEIDVIDDHSGAPESAVSFRIVLNCLMIICFLPLKII